jgi:hypothetical protein
MAESKSAALPLGYAPPRGVVGSRRRRAFPGAPGAAAGKSEGLSAWLNPSEPTAQDAPAVPLFGDPPGAEVARRPVAFVQARDGDAAARRGVDEAVAAQRDTDVRRTGRVRLGRRRGLRAADHPTPSAWRRIARRPSGASGARSSRRRAARSRSNQTRRCSCRRTRTGHRGKRKALRVRTDAIAAPRAAMPLANRCTCSRRARREPFGCGAACGLGGSTFHIAKSAPSVGRASVAVGAAAVEAAAALGTVAGGGGRSVHIGWRFSPRRGGNADGKDAREQPGEDGTMQNCSFFSHVRG